MHTLNWNHTRTGRPMTLVGTFGALTLRVMMVRQVFPAHPMLLDGTPV